VRNAASVLIGSAGGEVLTGYAIVLAAVTLGAAGFGPLSSAQALMEPFDVLAGFGLSQIVVTEAARRGGCDGHLRGTTLAIRLVFGVLAAAFVLLIAATTGRQQLLPVLLVLSVGTLLTQSTAVTQMPFEFDQAMHRPIFFPFLASLMRLATAYLAVYFMATPVGFQLSGLSAGVVSLLLNLWLSRRVYPARYGFDWTLAKRLIHAAWPVAVIQFVSMCYMRGSYFLLHASGPEVQGEFAAADRLMRPILTIGAVFFASSLPTVATMAAEGKFTSLLGIYRKAIARIVVFSLPVLGAAWVAAPWLLQRFIPEFTGASWPFRFLAIGTLFMYLNHLSIVFVFALRRQQLIMYVAVVNFVVYFSLALLLIPRYQAAGAAAATMVMEGINTTMQVGIVWALLRAARRRDAATSDATA
jgi:PST family polysaccharide transporter